MYRASRDHISEYSFTKLQRVALGLMVVLVCVGFIGTNMQALVWRHSAWLVSTVLPAVVVDLTNEERLEQHETPLRRSSVLDKAAQLKAEHMAKNEYFSHYSPDGVSPWYWFREVDYVYAHAGENLAIHFTDSDEVVDAWMKSPTHRANIIDERYTEIGVGTAKGTFEGYDTVYVVQLFGTPGVVSPGLTTTQVERTDIVRVAPPIAGATESTPLVEADKSNTQPADPAPAPVSLPDDVIKELPAVAIKPIPTSSPAVLVTRPLIATSSGLAIASIEETTSSPVEKSTRVGLVTRPQYVLEWTYLGLAGVIMMLISWSLVHEARRLHLVQVAYSIVLLLIMGGLWYVHGLLVGGAVVA